MPRFPHVTVQDVIDHGILLHGANIHAKVMHQGCLLHSTDLLSSHGFQSTPSSFHEPSLSLVFHADTSVPPPHPSSPGDSSSDAADNEEHESDDLPLVSTPVNVMSSRWTPTSRQISIHENTLRQPLSSRSSDPPCVQQILFTHDYFDFPPTNLSNGSLFNWKSGLIFISSSSLWVPSDTLPIAPPFFNGPSTPLHFIHPVVITNFSTHGSYFSISRVNEAL